MTTSTNAPAVAFILGMSEPRSRPSMSETMPSLAEVQRDPTILTGLPLPVIVDLRRQISHLAADVDAVLYQTLTEARTKDRADVEPDRLLTPEAAAARFGVTKRWLLDHAEEIPGVRRLSRKIVRFSKRRLARFLERTPV